MDRCRHLLSIKNTINEERDKVEQKLLSYECQKYFFKVETEGINDQFFLYFIHNVKIFLSFRQE